MMVIKLYFIRIQLKNQLKPRVFNPKEPNYPVVFKEIARCRTPRGRISSRIAAKVTHPSLKDPKGMINNSKSRKC